MFGYVKNLLRKWVETPDNWVETPDDTQPAETASAASAHARRIVMAPPLPGTAPARKNGSHQNGRGIELPLQPILGGLPLELQPRLRNADAGELTISIPLEKILAQLSRGSVKITFGELRQAAPHLFTPEEDRDRVLVPLPLGEILARLNPALITRRRAQKQVEIPAEICSPFDQRSQGLIFSVGPTKPESAPTPSPAPRHAAPAAPAPVAPAARGGLDLRAHAPAAQRGTFQRGLAQSARNAFRSTRLARAEHEPSSARLAGSGGPGPNPDSDSAADQAHE